MNKLKFLNFQISDIKSLLKPNILKITNFNYYNFATAEEVERKIKEQMKIESLEVKDISGGCGDSFLIRVKSPEFNGKTMIAQHRLVNDILKEELKGIHALQLKTEPTK